MLPNKGHTVENLDMAVEHSLKILLKYFDAVVDGGKTFELRKNDGAIKKEIAYILDGSSGYVPDGYVVMSIK